MKLRPFLISAAVVIVVLIVGYMVAVRGPVSIVADEPDTIAAKLIDAWPVFEKTIPDRPVLGSTSWNYPTTVQFLNATAILIEYDDGHILHYSVIKYDGSNFAWVKTLPGDKLSETDRQSLQKEYGSADFEPVAYQYSPTGSPHQPQPADWIKTSQSLVANAQSTFDEPQSGLSFTYPSTLNLSSSTPALWTGCQSFSDSPVSSCVSFVKVINLNAAGKLTASDYEPALLSDVTFDPSGMHPKSIGEFKKVIIGTHEFYAIRTGRFEGVLSYNYYLIEGSKIYVFSFISRSVDWTNPDLDEQSDPGHTLLRQILSTVVLPEPQGN